MRRVAVWGSIVTVLAAAALAVAPARAGAGDGAAGAYVATIRTSRGVFRAVMRDPVMIEKARTELRTGADAGVPIGRLAWGDGGVNRGHVWHVVELGFADFTIELCDGTARAVDRDPVYWVETVGQFCPWSGEVIGLRPLRPRA